LQRIAQLGAPKHILDVMQQIKAHSIIEFLKIF